MRSRGEFRHAKHAHGRFGRLIAHYRLVTRKRQARQRPKVDRLGAVPLMSILPERELKRLPRPKLRCDPRR